MAIDPRKRQKQLQRRQRVHETRGKPAQPAVAEPGLFLLFEQLRKILADARDGVGGRFPQPEVDQAVAEMRSCEEFG